MNAAFIIAEYNPFHNGHEYHIKKTISELQPDAVICIMSGHFTQRGSAAICDKWSRARMALLAGADLVLELHPVYACSSAEYFARGALMTAALTGIGGWLSFGAEHPDLSLFSDLAAILNDEPGRFKEVISDLLKKGLPYAAARQRALTECYFADSHRDKISRGELAAAIKSPNNILAIEYIRAIKSLNLPITPVAVPRTAEAGTADATEIRDWIRGSAAPNRGILQVRDVTPVYAAALLSTEFSLGRGPVFDDCFFTQLYAIIRRGGPGLLRTYRDVGEGLENRLYDAVLTSGSYDEVLEKTSAKRYPKSRIRRILTNVLLGCGGGEPQAIGAEKGPPYLRVLGFTDAGRKLLSVPDAGAPIITNYKKAAGYGERAKRFMELESRATDIFVKAFANAGFRNSGQDFIRAPARINVT